MLELSNDLKQFLASSSMQKTSLVSSSSHLSCQFCKVRREPHSPNGNPFAILRSPSRGVSLSDFHRQ